MSFEGLRGVGSRVLGLRSSGCSASRMSFFWGGDYLRVVGSGARSKPVYTHGDDLLLITSSGVLIIFLTVPLEPPNSLRELESPKPP